MIAPVGRRESYFVLGSKSGVKTAEKRKKLLKENGYDESQINIKLYDPKDNTPASSVKMQCCQADIY